jgi:GTP-binding protein
MHPARPVADPKPVAVDPLVIRSLEFVGGLASIGGWRPEANMPEIAFAGRSNVGKSSLLNKVLKRRSFARVSKTPGRTREINFFKVNGTFLLADLPGYGYAKVSKSRSAEWGPLIESYLRSTTLLRGVVQLLDVRHDPTDDDRQMLDFLADVGVPAMFVATKIDKLSRLAATNRVRDLAIILQVEEDQIIPFSAQTGEGRDELAGAISSLLATAEPTEPTEPTEPIDATAAEPAE